MSCAAAAAATSASDRNDKDHDGDADWMILDPTADAAKEEEDGGDAQPPPPLQPPVQCSGGGGGDVVGVSSSHCLRELLQRMNDEKQQHQLREDVDGDNNINEEEEEEANRTNGDKEGDDDDEHEHEDDFVLVAGATRVLSYDRYLAHQRYYDDLKHIDCAYVDFGIIHDDGTGGGGDDHKKKEENRVLRPEQQQQQLRLFLQQDKGLGKGGLCWDAAFVLGEYLIHQQRQQQQLRTMGMADATCTDGTSTTTTTTTTTSVIELGAGTGLCGLLLATACRPIIECGGMRLGNATTATSTAATTNRGGGGGVHVTITDLPPLLPLMERNVALNSRGCCCACDCDHPPPSPAATAASVALSPPPGSDHEAAILKRNEYLTSMGHSRLPAPPCHHHHRNPDLNTSRCHRPNITASVLAWGDREAEERHGTHDWVIGADVVASLYCPVALANTIRRLCHAKSTVYVSMKRRLDSVHGRFEREMAVLFESVEIIAPNRPKNEEEDAAADAAEDAGGVASGGTLLTSTSPPPFVCRNRNPAILILIARGLKEPSVQEKMG
jgi:Lysine methyltransferase